MKVLPFLDFFYNSWGWIAVISTLVGVIAWLPIFKRASDKPSYRNTSVQFIKNALSVVACTFLIISFLIGNAFTRVPKVYGGTVHDAEQTLKNAKLSIELEPGYTVIDDWSMHVIGQANENNIVPKGLKITVFLDSENTNGKIEPKPATGEVIVPRVIGMEQIEAINLLADQGLQFQVWWTEENNISVDQYYIIDQSIPAGSSVPAGSLVKLELSATKP